jgi:hypothetical protein
MSDLPVPQFPPTLAKISITAGPIHIEYEGPPEFLKDLPALIDELQKSSRGLPRHSSRLRPDRAVTGEVVGRAVWPAPVAGGRIHPPGRDSRDGPGR